MKFASCFTVQWHCWAFSNTRGQDIWQKGALGTDHRTLLPDFEEWFLKTQHKMIILLA